MFLVDTNIFLEVLLQQQQTEACKAFIHQQSGQLCISDFSLHSIGVITCRLKKTGLFTEFAQDMLPCLDVLSLPAGEYAQLETLMAEFTLDFDDAYQYLVARSHHLTLATLDSDFKKLPGTAVYFLDGKPT